MIEQSGDSRHEDWDRPWSGRQRPTKFRGYVGEGKKRKPREQPFRPAAKKTLLDSPDDQTLILINESGFPPRLLSKHSINILELSFRNGVNQWGLEKSDLSRWLAGEDSSKQIRIIKSLRGQIFEEVITREFVKKEQNYFLANPVLTSKIMRPILSELPRGVFSMPDHLVFSRDGPVATVVGFMEDKKYVDFISDERLFEQLEREWSLWLAFSRDVDLQSKFRRGVFENLPSLPHGICFASSGDGTIWLATTKDGGVPENQLPSWVRLFHSSVSERAINNLADILIKRRLLPRLLASMGAGISDPSNRA